MKMIKIKVEVATGSGARKGYCKHVTGIDTRHDNGYAFEGEFLNSGIREVPEGALILDVWPTGSVKNGSKVGVLKKAVGISADSPSGLERISKEIRDMRTEGVLLRDEARDYLQIQELVEKGPVEANPLAEFTSAELIAELHMRGITPL